MPIQNIQPFSYNPNAQYLFNRAYAIAIGAPGQTSALQYSNFPIQGSSMLQKASPLKVRFDITKNLIGSPAKAKFEIFNLSQQSRQAIKKGYIVQMQAGYNGLIETLFTGNIVPNGLKSARNGPDIITSMECGDGESSIVMTVLNKAYPAGTYLAQVVRDCALAMQLVDSDDPVGVNSGSILQVPEVTYGRGLTIEGPVKKTLDDLLKPQGLRWYVTNGNLNIIPVKSTNGSAAIVVSKDTGMIGTPSQNDQYTEFAALLNPKLLPGQLVQLISENTSLNGFYKIMSGHYEGDTHDSKWQVTCQCVAVNNVAIPLTASNGFDITGVPV